MAFTAGTIWEVETTGDDTNNGGGFDTGVSGFPTDLTTDTNTGNTSTPIVSSASYNFQSGDIGHWVFIKSGTNWIPGWYQITAVSSNKATLNAAVGAAVLYNTPNSKLAMQPNTVVGVATVGTPTSGTWGVDYSQKASSVGFTSTHFSSGAGNTLLSDADNTIGKNWVGNIISITAAGTGFTIQRVAVVSTSGTVATVDKTLGGTGLTGGGGKLGGALVSPGLAGGLFVANNFIFVQSGSYTISSATANVTGGCPSLAASTGGSEGRIEGYQIVRGDLGTRPTLTASGISTFSIITLATKVIAANLILDGASLTSSRGINTASNVSTTAYRIKASNFTNAAFNVFRAIFCEATGCSTVGPFACPVNILCWAHNNTITGFNNSTGTFGAQASYVFCISSNNTGASSDGFNPSNSSGTNIIINCITYTNGRDGIRTTNGSTSQWFIANCIAYANVGTGFNVDAPGAVLQNCAYRSNGTDVLAGTLNIGGILLTADPFTNAAGDDYSLNLVAGGGQSCRSAGMPGVFPGATMTGYLDIGAIQARWPIVAAGMGGG